MATDSAKIKSTTAVFVEDYEVSARLKKLGLTHDTLTEAVRRGELQRRLGSHLDPKPAPGFAAWARTIRALREGVLEYRAGWHPEDIDGVPLIMNEDETIAITASSGDSNTGRPDTGIDPASKNPKGEATAEAVKNNTPMLDGFPTPTTWILLYHSSDDGLYAELSCPMEMAVNGYITVWSERVILGEIDLGEDGMKLDIHTESVADDTIEVSVIRRTS